MYTLLASWENLLLAYQKAARHKRGQPNVAAFEYRLEDNLLQLQTELASFTYCPGPYHSFTIHEPKRRLISNRSLPLELAIQQTKWVDIISARFIMNA